MTTFRNLPEIGAGIVGRAVTATLYVSPNGSGVDGKTWASAYTTIQAALDAASTNANDCTQIVVGPHATFYDINTTGDPTWTGNYEIIGSHRLWAPIKNTHASAASVMKFTGWVSIRNLAIFQTAAINGVIFTNSGFRIRNCGFNSEELTNAATSIHIDGSAAITRGGIIENIQILGHATYTTGLYINTSKVNEFKNMYIHKCLTGIQIVGATSDYNGFSECDIGNCALGVDIDEGNESHFSNILFHDNTINVDDEVGDTAWGGIQGQFEIDIHPDSFTGVSVNTGDGVNTWTTVPVILYTHAGSGPFRVVGTHIFPSSSEFYRLRYTADDGATWFDDLMFDTTKREGMAALSGTEFIFNAGTVIKAVSKSASAGVDLLQVWLEIQDV